MAQTVLPASIWRTYETIALPTSGASHGLGAGQARESARCTARRAKRQRYSRRPRLCRITSGALALSASLPWLVATVHAWSRVMATLTNGEARGEDGQPCGGPCEA